MSYMSPIPASRFVANEAPEAALALQENLPWLLDLENQLPDSLLDDSNYFPFDSARTDQDAQRPPLSYTEMDYQLTDWVSDARGSACDARGVAKGRILACFHAAGLDPSSEAAQRLDLSDLSNLGSLPECIGELTQLSSLALDPAEYGRLLGGLPVHLQEICHCNYFANEPQNTVDIFLGLPENDARRHIDSLRDDRSDTYHPEARADVLGPRKRKASDSSDWQTASKHQACESPSGTADETSRCTASQAGQREHRLPK